MAATFLTERGSAPPGAWWTVALCCLLYTFSFIDRLVLSLLVPDISRDLAISDLQMGLLIGLSFSAFYTIAGLPLAHWLDRGSRKWIMTGGVLLWGSMTVLSGFATSFAELAFYRAGVALGEAALTPGAISMIGDLFPRRRRVAPTALYASIASFMSIGGFAVSAAALQLAHGLETHTGMVPWRMTLVLAGMPSILLGVLFALTVREPARSMDETDEMAGTGMIEFLRHAYSRSAFYIPLLIGISLFTTFLFGIVAWTPTLLVRAHGMANSQAGYVFGVMGAVVGLGGAALWPNLVGWLGRRGALRSPLLTGLQLGVGLCLAGGIVGLSSTGLSLLLAGLVFVLVGGNAAAMLVPLIAQTYAPARMRASGAAVFLLPQNLVGYGVGPLLVAWISTGWRGDANALGHGLLITLALTLPATLVALYFSNRHAPVAPAGGNMPAQSRPAASE